MRILILSAFRRELDHVIETFTDLKETTIAKRWCMTTKRDGHDIVITLSGIGTTAAASTTTAFCEALEPDLIIMCGVAGGLYSGMQVGDLVLGSKIIDADLFLLKSSLENTPYEACLTDPHTLQPIKSEYIVESSLLEVASFCSLERLKIGNIATSNIFPAPKSLFADIKGSACIAIEMESVGVFKAAEYYSIPTMTLRAISNILNEDGTDLGTELDALKVCSTRIALFLNGFINNLLELGDYAEKKQQNRIAELVSKYNLSLHPEGGWYCQTFKSNDLVKAEGGSLDRYSGETRAAGTSIIYLLAQSDFSAWHSVQSDETWYFHTGDPLLLRVIDPVSSKLEEVILDATTGLLQFTVKAGYIFSAESQGRFSLMGCVVTPGFDFKDFKLVSTSEFLTKYPQHAVLSRLARDKKVETDVLDARFFGKKNKDDHEAITHITPSFM